MRAHRAPGKTQDESDFRPVKSPAKAEIKDLAGQGRKAGLASVTGPMAGRRPLLPERILVMTHQIPAAYFGSQRMGAQAPFTRVNRDIGDKGALAPRRAFDRARWREASGNEPVDPCHQRAIAGGGKGLMFKAAAQLAQEGEKSMVNHDGFLGVGWAGEIHHARSPAPSPLFPMMAGQIYRAGSGRPVGHLPGEPAIKMARHVA